MAVPFQMNVQGMHCQGCADTIQGTLQKNGISRVSVDHVKGIVHARLPEGWTKEQVAGLIRAAGYTPVLNQGGFRWKISYSLWISSLLTLPLLGHMWVHHGILAAPWFQFLLALPVFIIGVYEFGSSAWASLRRLSPNMDVLIMLGSSSAMGYSLYGWLAGLGPDFLFFETAAAIITLLLLGHFIEMRVTQKTRANIEALRALKPRETTLVKEDGSMHTVPAESLQPGQKVMVRPGETVPADGLVLDHDVSLDTSSMTGEFELRQIRIGEEVLAGFRVKKGFLVMEVKKAGDGTVLAQMVQMVEDAKKGKPSIQRLGDKVSAWFVPVVVLLALVLIPIEMAWLELPFKEALLRSVAVLVIACPCAMGLATPAAVSVGLGKAARRGILIRSGEAAEIFSSIRFLLLDKTGTITETRITRAEPELLTSDLSMDQVQSVARELVRPSAHPVSRSLSNRLKDLKLPSRELKKWNEVEGSGVTAVDEDGRTWKLGNADFCGLEERMDGPAVYLACNERPIASWPQEEALKSGVKESISYFKKRGISCVLISGDSHERTQRIAGILDIPFHAAQLPTQKFQLIEEYSAKGRTAMFGDGLNDSAALSRAHVGISHAQGTQLAQDQSQVILMGDDVQLLWKAHLISRKTMAGIRQNLFWALAYNLVAIPVAAAGALNPMWAALGMAFSDVVVLGNSLRLALIPMDSQ